jgi:hypothetical protein
LLRVLAALLVPGAPAAGWAQARAGWVPEDRLLISDFSTVVGIAGDGFRIHAATLNGLITWDPARREWELPLTFEDGYPVLERPSALAWSTAEQALVLGTRAGRLWRLDAAAGRAEPLGEAGGPVEALLAVEGGDLYVRTATTWLLIAAGSVAPRPSSPPPASLRASTDERLRSLAGALGLDGRLRRWPVTALTEGTRPDDYYVGTAGGGVQFVDARTLAVTPLPFGGTGRGVSAVVEAGGRLWFGGGEPAPGRSSVFSADTSLRQWSWPDPVRDGAPGSAVRVLVGGPGGVWAGAADGLHRFSPEGGWKRFDTRDGLPGASVTSLASSDGELWVGTRQGACLWRGTTCGPPILPGTEITALAFCGRDLWLGTRQGLWRATASGLDRAEPPGFSGPVRALACHAGALYLAGQRLLLVLEGDAWHPPIPIGGSGSVRSLAATATGVWVGADGGAARWDRAAGEWETYLVPGDIPAGPVLGVLALGRSLWLATPAGALRLELHPR